MEQSPAPALTRGIAILERLSARGSTSLEHLSRDLGIPKTSTLRLLEALEASHAVRRDPESKLYVATKRLLPVATHEEILRSAALGILSDLAERSHCVVELYAWDGSVCYMIDRCIDAGEPQQLFARIGFTRDTTEFDALLQVVSAATDTPVNNRQLWQWDGDANRPLSDDEYTELFTKARHENYARDFTINSNGIWREATPICENNQCVGALAIAHTAQDQSTFQSALRTATDAIQFRLQQTHQRS